ncbi:concanavalin A-like lectin/glucanase domain-containing protein, partial [Ilyonectria destructans]
GEQCTANSGLTSDGYVAWSVDWTWSGGDGHVKSYPRQLSRLRLASCRPSATSRRSGTGHNYPGDDIVANVAYDLFTSSTDCGDYEYGFVIWLDALGGAGPISATGSSIATVTLADDSWDVYQGTNSRMTVFSFVATETTNSFCGDLIDFVDYLTGNQGVSKSQRIQSIGAGTGPFTG